jgi:hypothetical protein
MAYFTLAGGSLKYELTAEDFRIRFGLFNKKIAYSRISSVENVSLSLNLRLFGASLPGFHWGLYRTNIGNAHVYGTRISGEYIVLTLQNGQRIAISPEETDRLLEALCDRTRGYEKSSSSVIKHEERSARKYLYAQIISVSLVYAVFIGYFFWVYASLPQVVPVHFGFDGVANRWADKSELLWLVGIACALPIVNAVLSVKFGRYERGLLILLGAIFAVSAALFFYALNTIAVIS